VKSLGERGDLLGKLYYFASIWRRTRGANPVLVYSLGKVGTTSLVDTIERCSGRPAIQCHRVTRAEVRSTRGYVPRRRGRPLVAWRGEYVRHLVRLKPWHKWDVVCGVRDPVARSVSAIFQMGDEFGFFEDAEGDRGLDAIAARVTSLHAENRAGLDWFSTGLQAVTGVDVYGVPFDHDAGWQIYESGRFRVLLIRFEDLARVAPTALARFLRLRDLPSLPTKNVGSDKPYADLYRRFLAADALPGSVLDEAYSCQLATHFYTPAERAAFRDRWTRRPAGGLTR
jgi:hypothetical protein